MAPLRPAPPSRTRIIVSSSVTFAALSLLPKVLAIVKDMFVAARFGASDTLDTYLIAFVLIGLPVAVVSVSLQTALTPALVGKDRDAAARLLGGAIKLALGNLVVILPVWLLALPWICSVLYPGLSPAAIGRLVSACIWLTPYYLLNGMSLLLYGALQARKTFWPNAVLPGLFPLAILLSLWATDAASIHVLLAGTVLGSACEGLALLLLLRRAGWLRVRDTAGAGLLKVVRLAAPLAAGGVIGALAPVFEQLIAFRLGEGAVSLLSFGFKVPAALASLLVTGIGVVVLPHFAELIAQRAWRPCGALYLRLGGLALAVGIAVAGAGIPFSGRIVRILFERGAFLASHTAEAASVMRMYLLQLPSVMFAVLSMRALVALGRTGTMTAIVAAQVCLGCWLSYAFSERLGVAGVALGTSAAALVGAIALAAATWLNLAARMSAPEEP